MKAIRIFGSIPGIYEGTTFRNRIEVSLSKVHSPLQAGISGSQKEGADSIVVSGGYEDDEDYGDVIIYTGHGGRNIDSGKQVTDQELVRGNLALALNCQNGLPVRVIRGAHDKSIFAPEEGYRYDGLFRVEEYWKEKGKHGFYVWRFKLRKIDYSINPRGQEFHEEAEEYVKAKRVETRIQRIIRETSLSNKVKVLYDFKCQVCDTSILTNIGAYVEAAHIKPLGAPHDGPDTLDNLICLCPNHHVMFDFGGFSILQDFNLIGIEGKLKVNANHKIKREFLQYHFNHFYDEKNRIP